ncbi:MAG: FlgD immunoglobulin-like domain containing protein [Candidatus Zixiibacteriota bacterium]
MRVTKCLIVALAVLVVIPMIATAAGVPTTNKMTLGTPEIAATGDNGVNRRVTVPISIDNTQELVAMDIPLSFGQPGDGIQLVGVAYASRINYFDEKITNIDNNKKTVIMGLISMAYQPGTPDLTVGSGEIARLTFEISDPTMTEFTISAATMERPYHRLLWVYNVYDAEHRPTAETIEPEFTPITVAIPAGGTNAVPATFALAQNYPNPFNAGTVIRFGLPKDEAGNVKLVVYNVLGQSVRTLADRDFEPGNHEIAWDGTDNNGSPASSGVYFYRIQTKHSSDTKKMTLLK